MLEGVNGLIELQRVDAELSALEGESAELPARRARLEARSAACAERLEAARSALAAGEADQRRAEAQLQDAEELLRRLESQQFQVKSNEAYTALLHEMEGARQSISDSETRILEAMEAIESGRAGLAQAERGGAAELREIETKEKILEQREQELTRRIAQLRQEREGVCAGLAADLLQRYQRVSERRRPAVVIVSGELCTGCRVDIPPQDYIEILKSERLVTCLNCHRILLHETARAASTSR